jgi:predicted O-methyltransferase YrrM
MFVPPGHFYSPIANLDEVRERADKIFLNDREKIPGIDMREEAQWALVQQFSHSYYLDIPFNAEPLPGRRYGFDNQNYSYSDGVFLHCMIRHAKPRRIVEVGSGFSSACTLDTNDLFFDGDICCEFIEPYPDQLLLLISQEDRDRIRLHHKPLQDVSLDLFASLEPNDILFIDSTHVSRVGSDVNYIIHEILPALKPGVFVHFHDVFWPMEYPRAWVEEGRSWNEIYMLRAFLQFNPTYEIVLMNTFLETRDPAWFDKNMPLCMKNPGGSIWLRKIS